MAWIDSGRPSPRGTSQGDRVPGLTADRTVDDESTGSPTTSRWPTSSRRWPRRTLRGRHRVPSRAHVLPAGRARAAGVGRPASPLVDPLAVDLAPLAKVLEGPGVAVMHAAGQDLEVLELACGTVPTTLFDTQLAAGFAGYATPSLAALAEQVRRRPPAQGRPPHRLAAPAARRRPAQLRGVRRRPPLRDPGPPDRRPPRRAAGSSGRSTSASSCAPRSRSLRAPEDAWLRIKEARHLRGATAGIARAVAAWRERRAAEIDQPVRFVLPDLAVVGHRAAGPEVTRPAAGDPWPRRPPRAGPPRRASCSRRSPHGREHPAVRPRSRRDRRARARAPPGGHARVGLGQPAGPRPAHRHLAARHPGRHRGAPRRHRGRPAQRGLAGRPRRRADPPPRGGRRRPRLRRQGRPRPRGALPQAASSD